MQDFVRRAIDDFRYSSRLSRAGRSEFEELVAQVKPNRFLHYRHASQDKLVDVRSALDVLAINPGKRTFLDIGPAHGDSRQVWLDRGGADWQYIERDQWCAAHLRLLGARGWQGNHFKLLRMLPRHGFDVIWSKGGISAQSIDFRFFGLKKLKSWLDTVLDLLAPNGVVVLCPHWRNTSINGHWFARTLDDYGFVRQGSIKYHNSDRGYPITWRFDSK